MFDPGISELFLIAVIALVVLGPERLPVVARKVGRFIGNMQRMFVGFQHELQRHTQIIEQPVREVKEVVEDELGALDLSVSDDLKDIKSNILPLDKPGGNHYKDEEE